MKVHSSGLSGPHWAFSGSFHIDLALVSSRSKGLLLRWATLHQRETQAEQHGPSRVKEKFPVEVFEIWALEKAQGLSFNKGVTLTERVYLHGPSL